MFQRLILSRGNQIGLMFNLDHYYSSLIYSQIQKEFVQKYSEDKRNDTDYLSKNFMHEIYERYKNS
jgi:hypothetical protein